MRYFWAAYRMGGLDDFDVAFRDHGMQPDAFAETLATVIPQRDVAAVLIADHKEGRGPVGFVGAMNPLGTRLMIVMEFIWFPWASPRNKLESAINFFNDFRDEYAITAYADDRPADSAHDRGVSKPMYEHICKYGVMRRVGTLHDLFGPGASAAMYQTRRRKN